MYNRFPCHGGVGVYRGHPGPPPNFGPSHPTFNGPRPRLNHRPEFGRGPAEGPAPPVRPPFSLIGSRGMSGPPARGYAPGVPGGPPRGRGPCRPPRPPLHPRGRGTGYRQEHSVRPPAPHFQREGGIATAEFEHLSSSDYHETAEHNLDNQPPGRGRGIGGPWNAYGRGGRGGLWNIPPGGAARGRGGPYGTMGPSPAVPDQDWQEHDEGTAGSDGQFHAMRGMWRGRGQGRGQRGFGRGRGGIVGQKRPANDGDNQCPPKPKKKKIDKRDLPENNKFFCETCDRGFKNENKYEEHLKTHTKCHVEGCSYVAAKKLVQQHYMWHHVTGVANQIWKLESPQDIEKWRAERRKNFPTAENRARKVAMAEQRMKRGEVIETKYFGKMRGRGRGRGRGRWRGHDHHRQNDTDQIVGESTEDIPSSSKSDEDDDNDMKVRKEKLGTTENTSEGSQDFDKTKSVAIEKESQVAGGLVSLLTSYGDLTDSEEENALDKKPLVKDTLENSEEVWEAQYNKVKTKLADSGKLEVGTEVHDDEPQDTEFGREVSTQGEAAQEGQEEEEQEEEEKKEAERANCPLSKGQLKRKRRKRRKKYPDPHAVPPKVPSLLEKLLAKEIRHERNVLLQCVRYIVKKNYFGIGH